MIPPMVPYAETDNPLRGLCQAIEGKIERARLHKKPWQDVADECDFFYSAVSGFLWRPENRWRFWNTTNGAIEPQFQITCARAFELVALFGPTLYWANPTRTAKPRDFVEIPPEVFGVMADQQQQAQAMQQQAAGMLQQGDPLQRQQAMAMQQQAMAILQQQQQAASQYQQALSEFQQESLQRNMSAQLQARILNHTPDLLELHDHSDRAITDLLVKGRGVFITEPYRHPGSNKLLVGSFYETPDRVFIDPDCENAKNAHWVAVERYAPYWEVERKFKLFPEGVLKNASSYQSGNSQGTAWAMSANTANNRQQTGEAKDMIRYWEFYSREGVGIRGLDLPTATQRALESATGDYVYMVVAPGIPYLLNCPDWVLQQGTVAEVKSRLSWPIPFWTEGKFPVTFLDVYQRTRYPWPLPPLAPGLGELKAINIFLCSLCHHVWMSSRTLTGVLESAKEEVQKALERGKDFAIFGLESLQDDLSKVVQFLTHPPVNYDVWKILDALMEMFDRRVGLSEILYGMQGPASRSATDVKVRQANTAIRPQDMARRVAACQTELARKESYGLWYSCTPEDLADILGNTGAQLWGRYVKSQPGERVLRQIDYAVEASSMARPDNDRDAESLRNFIQVFGPIHQQYAAASGDTSTINALQQLFGKVNGMKMDGLMLKPPQPQQPPDPTQNPEFQAKQLEMQQEQQRAQTELQQQQAAFEAEQAQRGAQFGQKMQQDMEAHRAEMLRKVSEGSLDLQQKYLDTIQKAQQGQLQLRLAKQKAKAPSNGAAKA